jgi:uracil-DNA glycosylase family 4
VSARTDLRSRIVACERCPRLVEHCREVARVKRRAYRDEDYWGKPVPTFGAADPRLFIVGLAPGAHGANRTGRVFTGDSSGLWLYRALHEAGFASREESRGPGDGLRLKAAAVSCAVRCAPPGNRPTPLERDACLPYLVEELRNYRRIRVLMVLGRFSFDAARRAWAEAGRSPWKTRPAFGHGLETCSEDGKTFLLCSYHPSRQNTQTGRLTRADFQRPLDRARALLKETG